MIGIDYAIHFIQRYRQLRGAIITALRVNAGGGRAIRRSLGFVPMLFASLVTYIIVGQLPQRRAA